MTAATAQSLTGLVARLTKPEDRETYAGLISYFHSLPDHDELFHIVELLGLLTLLGQRIPAALAEAMTQMGELTTKAGEYYGAIDERLDKLPAEITNSLDMAAIARTIGEAFRQQFASTGLEASAAHLRATASGMATLTSKLKPVIQQYTALVDSITAGVAKLTAASDELQRRGVQRNQSECSTRRLWHSLLLLVTLLVGVAAGLSLR